MKKHPSIIPFVVYIANDEKHMERFAVCAKYMTFDPMKTNMSMYICNIQTIQVYLWYIPVDAMGSSHNMMAIVHMDGTVANAWPLSPLQVEKQPVASIFAVRAVGTPLAGPLSVARSQLANPDFGSLEEIEVSDSDEENEEEKGESKEEDSGSGLEPVEEDFSLSPIDVSYVDVDEEDDAFWDDNEATPTPRLPPSSAKRKLKTGMICLHSSDQAAAAVPDL
ncbi:unnamed protein product [Sphagnum balticum]